MQQQYPSTIQQMELLVGAHNRWMLVTEQLESNIHFFLMCPVLWKCFWKNSKYHISSEVCLICV
jgi:hypothetical protein